MAKAKKPQAKNKPTVLQVAGGKFVDALGAAAVKKLKVKLGLNTEDKFVDVAGTTTSTATLVKRIASPTIAQGLTVNTRSGASIRITRADLRITAVTPAAATTANVIRVIVVRHREADEPTASEILATTTDITSPQFNSASARGVDFLMDQNFTIGTATGGDGSVSITRSFTSDNWQMVWTNSDTTGVPTNLIEGSISVWWMIDNVTTAPVFTSTMRLWYVDN